MLKKTLNLILKTIRYPVMVNSKYQSALLSGILAIASIGFFAGEMSPHVRGLSPYYSAASNLEERVFLEAGVARQNRALLYDNKVRDKIYRIISDYNTGLDGELRKQVSASIIGESKKYGYDPLFLTALIITESSFNNWARSNRGALGLMQIRPRTGLALAAETSTQWKGKPTLYDPGINIALGSYYLNKLLNRFGDLTLALEAYNHGPSKLDRYLRKGYRPNKYSLKVLKKYKMIKSLPT